MTTKNNFRFCHRLRVRWAEVDMQKIVFNAHYLMYFDTAITDYWRTVGLPYDETMHRLGGELFVKKASVEYHASAEMDDILDVCLRCERIGNSSLTFVAGIFRGSELLITGELVYVFADPIAKKSRPLPSELRETFEGYERGEDMMEVRAGSWADLQEMASLVRTEVFVHEQGVPAEMEWDHEDDTALHAVVFNRLGMPLATGRLLNAGDGTVRIGRMAVKKQMRGSNLGRTVLKTLTVIARERGVTEVRLHAQCSAEGFYERSGFESRGPIFEEAGMPHVEMVRALT